MIKNLGVFILVASLVIAPSVGVADVRIKDIVSFEGVRQNQLVGYGLVVGLNGTGDSLRSSPFTRKSIEGMLERLGAGNMSTDNIDTNNTAAVMVTANLPPFSRRGSTIDVTVSSLGDATSLRGGTLVVTPMAGADGETYAVAQGPVSVSGYSVQGNAASIVDGVPTVARVPNGAIVEREVEFALDELETVRLSLNVPDFTTADRIATAINEATSGASARMLDNATVEIMPVGKVNVPAMLAAIENIRVQPDNIARVVVDAKSGTIVIGADVRINEVAVSQGGLTVMVRENFGVSQPEPFSIGETVVVPQTDIQVREEESGFAVLNGDVSLQELVDGLNAIGMGARETISILQAIKAAGALHADLEII